MKRIIKLAALVAIIITTVSCNLDSGQGVYQNVFNDTPQNFQKIISVLGVIDDKLVVFANYDLYSFDGERMKKESEITAYNYVPFMAADGHIYFSYVENGVYGFFRATFDEINNGLDNDFIHNPENQVNVTLPPGSEGDIVLFNGLYNFNIDETQVTYTLSADNEKLTDPNKKIMHYGYITKSGVTGNTITIHGGQEVPSSATIIGRRALRLYIEDSDIEIGHTPLKDANRLYILNEEGNNIDYQFNVGDADYDNLVMGTDGEYFLTLEGDLYRITGASTYELAVRDFATDLIYRNNTLMPVYETGRESIGYLYEEGIYINPHDDKAPRMIRVTDDNDLVTSAWIGDNGSNRYLMATQENGFWTVVIEEKDGNYSGTSIHQYDSEIDGALSEYLN